MLEKSLMLEKCLIDLCNEYDVPKYRVHADYMNYEQLLGRNLGMTWSKYNDEGETAAQIGISIWLCRHSLAARSVLWHEFCHAESWIKDHQQQGHGDKWRRRVMRKPFLYFVSCTWTQLIYAIEEAKRRTT